MKKCLLRKASIGIYNEELVLKCERYRTDSTHLLGKCKLTNPMLCYVKIIAHVRFSFEIKILADLGARIRIWKLTPGQKM